MPRNVIGLIGIETMPAVRADDMPLNEILVRVSGIHM
jgi:hypothetical protein